MIEIQAPNEFEQTTREISIFLGGTIDMGNSFDWQKDLVQKCEKFPNLIIWNPRRDDYDASWEQTTKNPLFVEQVKWELSHLAKSDIILIHYEPGSTSQISLLEHGLFWHQNMYIHCPEGFSRKGNIDIVCEEFKIPMLENLDDILEIIAHKS
jgi:hypothetical protein